MDNVIKTLPIDNTLTPKTIYQSHNGIRDSTRAIYTHCYCCKLYIYTYISVV